MAWQNGPLPPKTYGWGGVVPYDVDIDGFYLAVFAGDKVTCYPGERVLQAHEVKKYDNSLTLPSGMKSTDGVGGRAEE